MDGFEAIVVGAGPAGAMAARDLARAGARVAIFDGSHPREKPCGGGVTGRAIELVRHALDQRGVRHVPIDTATFEHHAAQARTTIAGEPDGAPPLVIVSRREFDAALLA